MPLPGLTAAILAHPSREDRAVRLARQLAELDPILVFDHDPGPGNLEAALRAWSWAYPDRYHVVMQDDALPVPGFAASAAQACEAAKGRAVTFWMRPWHPDSIHHERATPGSLIPVSLHDHWPPSVAIALPGNKVPGFLDHAEECHADSLYDDDVLGCYLREAGMRLVATSPSIVDHGRGASILHTAQRHRRYRGTSYLADVAPGEWRLR